MSDTFPVSSFEPDFGSFDYDPLDDAEILDDLDDFDGEPISPSSIPSQDIARPKVDARPAEQRISELFETLASQRKVLLDVINLCAIPTPAAAACELIADHQAREFSIYDPSTLCEFLERAGALRRVTEQGDPYPETLPEPVVVNVDGVEYYETPPAPTVCLEATAEGAAFAAADRPADRLRALFADEERYRPIYLRILSLCDAEGGATAEALGDAVNKDPLLEEPRLLAPHFVNRLERCDALAWDGAWVTTEVGRSMLAESAARDDR